MKKTTSLALAGFILGGCASTGHVVQSSQEKIVAPRVIALDAPRAPWVMEIQNRLEKKGFRVLRWSSRARVTEQRNNGQLASFNETEARYVLVVDGYAPYDAMQRCFGGGYNFSHISTDLVDAATNSTLLNINGAGYSENCPPMSGSIFSDIANAVDAVWRE